MEKKYFFILLLFIIPVLTNGQINSKKTWNLSAGTDLIYPENNFRKTHGWGYGFSLKAEYLFQKHTSLTIGTGWYHLSGRRNDIFNPDADPAVGFPIKAGLRYYLGTFYIGGEGGWIQQSKFRIGNGFIYSFSIGDELITGKHQNSLDLSIRHEVWNTDKPRGLVALRLAYEFRLK